MKILNIFKKGTKSTVKSNIQSLDKNQLNKVIGGAESTATSERKSGSVVAADYEYR